MAANGYPNPDLLVEPDWLAEHGRDAKVRILDCAPIVAYNRAHIPGAVGLPVNSHLKDPANDALVLPAGSFAQLMGSLGVGDDTLVIAYDDDLARQSTRMWWVLSYYGHPNVKVLNGGWHRWLAEGRPVTMQRERPAEMAFTVRVNPEINCLVDDLKARVGRAGSQILDARADEEWHGAEKRGNRRAGRVPGSMHLEWTRLVTDDDRRVFLPADELQGLVDAAGVTADGGEIVTYCQGGVRAAHVMFALKLLGYERVRNYDGSMKEWANRDDTPLIID